MPFGPPFAARRSINGLARVQILGKSHGKHGFSTDVHREFDMYGSPCLLVARHCLCKYEIARVVWIVTMPPLSFTTKEHESDRGQ